MDSFDLSFGPTLPEIDQSFLLAPVYDPNDRSNRESFTVEKELELEQGGPYDFKARRIAKRKAEKAAFLAKRSINTKRRPHFKSYMVFHVENLRKKTKARQDRIKEAKEKNEAKREKWIKVNLIRRVLFGDSFNLRCYVAKARMDQRHPYLSVSQKERIDVLFKNYRKRAFWAMADNGLMPKGLLNESIAALDNSSIMNKALIMDISGTSRASTDSSANGSSANDEGFNDSIKDNLEKEDHDLPRLVDYLDDPLEVGSTEYYKILGI